MSVERGTVRTFVRDGAVWCEIIRETDEGNVRTLNRIPWLKPKEKR